MPYPRHLDNRSLEELFAIVERNRWERLRSQHLSDEESASPADQEVDADISPEDVKVVLFGTEGPFAFSMIEMFRQETVIAFFDDPERMISFCLSHKIKKFLLDLDPPTDCYKSTDIFNALKMLMPDCSPFLCTKRPNSLEAGTLRFQGAAMIEKPILRKDVVRFCRENLRGNQASF